MTAKARHPAQLGADSVPRGLVHKVGPITFVWYAGAPIEVYRDGAADPFTTIDAEGAPFKLPVLVVRATRWLKASGW